MSKATADSSDEQASRAFDLSDEIYIKLAQAYGVCDATRQARARNADHEDEIVASALWAATDLIHEAQKAFEELRAIKQPS